MQKYIKQIFGLTVLFICILSCAGNDSPTKAQKTVSGPKQSYQDIYTREQAIITTYEVLDAEKGLYRIPVSKAMEIIAKEETKK